MWVVVDVMKNLKKKYSKEKELSQSSILSDNIYRVTS